MNKFQYAAIIVIQILCTIVLFMVAYIMTLAWKSRQVAIQTVREGIKTLKDEPDTLIEQWQEGFIMGLKNFLEKKSQKHGIDIVNDLIMINALHVVKEMNLCFIEVLNDPDHSGNIRIIDKSTGKDWIPESERFSKKETSFN